MILHLKPSLMWCMLFVGNTNLTNMTELGDLTLDIIITFCVKLLRFGLSSYVLGNVTFCGPTRVTIFLE